MKAYEMAIGTRIAKRYSEGRAEGTVIANNLRAGDEVVAVEWDFSSQIDTVNVNDVRIIPSVLDRDYEQIRKSITESHAALLEAVEIVERHGISLRDDVDYEDVSFNDLETAINEVPWASSSSNC
jgi:hypothetical protein